MNGRNFGVAIRKLLDQENRALVRAIRRNGGDLALPVSKIFRRRRDDPFYPTWILSISAAMTCEGLVPHMSLGLIRGVFDSHPLRGLPRSPPQGPGLGAPAGALWHRLSSPLGHRSIFTASEHPASRFARPCWQVWRREMRSIRWRTPHIAGQNPLA